MLTDSQKVSVLTAAVNSFNRQKGTALLPSDFQVVLEAPNFNSLCSLIIQSTRTDDNMRMKLYVNFSTFTDVGAFTFLQEQNYGPGPEDEVWVADCKLEKREFSSVYAFVISPSFVTQLTSTNHPLLESGEGRILLESGLGFPVFENSIVA